MSAVAVSRASWADEISWAEVLKTLKRHRRLIVILPISLGLLFGLMTVRQPRRYLASASFLPQTSQSGAPSGAASLAEQFGFNISAGGGGQSPQFYADLLKSIAILKPAVEAQYEVKTDDNVIRHQTLVSMLGGNSGALPPWRRAVNQLSGDILTSVDRETGVVRLRVLASSASLAEQIATKLLQLVNDFNLQVRQRRAQEESRFLGDRLSAAQADLAAAEAGLEEFERQNRDFRNSPQLALESERRQRTVVMRQDVYTSLLRLQEQSRMDAVRDTPVLTFIDQPAGSAVPQNRGTVVRAFLGFALGLVLAIALAYGGEILRGVLDRRRLGAGGARA